MNLLNKENEKLTSSFIYKPYSAFYAYKLRKFRTYLQKLRSEVELRLHRKTKSPVDKSKIKRILIVKDEGMGDMLIVTALIRNLAKAGYIVDVLATEFNRGVIAFNPHVNEILTSHEAYKDRHYDLVMDVRFAVRLDTMERMTFCQDIPCDYLMTFNRSNFSCYDISLDFYEEKQHVTRVLDMFLNYLGIYGSDLSYDACPDAPSYDFGMQHVHQWRTKGSPLVAINPYASHTNRDMSTTQLQALAQAILARYPQAQIVCIGLYYRLSDLHLPGVTVFPTEMITQVMPIIESADLVITPDTFAVHIASAYKKPTLALYVPTLRNPVNPKETIKRDFYVNRYLLENEFFDAPRIQAGVRPKQVLLIEDLFAPNNINATQLISPGMNVSDFPAPLLIEHALQILGNNF